MSTENKTGKNIWDVIFSQDKHHFPIQRNYLQEPRGSNNPINKLVTQEVCHETVEYIRKTYPDPNELYALDFELNYTIRKLADFILYVDMAEFNRWDWEDVQFPPLEDVMSYLHKLYRWSDDVFCYADLDSDIFELTDNRNEIKISEWDHFHYHHMVDASRFQQAVQYVIENSDSNWKTKAEAFLRASSGRGYSPADDETIIYLMSQSLVDESLAKEAQHRWDRYEKEWEALFFTDKNPFKDRFSIDGLRFIHWDKLSILRPLEPLMLKSELTRESLTTNILGYQGVMHGHRDTYNYKIEAQHMLSADFLSDYVKAFSIFRTDLDVDPIRFNLPKVISRFYKYLAGFHDFEYNYTVADIFYLSDLIFSFASSRFQHDILNDDSESIFVNKARKEIELSFKNSTTNFIQDIPLVTLIALEVHAICYSSPRGMVDFLQKAKKWLLSQQTSYGYWYDGVNNPEYTTVLVLDALKLIDGEDGLSFPFKTQPKYAQEKLYSSVDSLLIVHVFGKVLVLGDRQIKFNFKKGQNKTWNFICELMTAKIYKTLAVPIKTENKDWKPQFDTLRNMCTRQLSISKEEATALLKHFIQSDGESYRFTEHVKFDKGSSVGIRPTYQY